MLTKRQNELLTFLRNRSACASPLTLSEMAAGVGLTTRRAALGLVNQLHERGRVRVRSRRPFVIDVLPPKPVEIVVEGRMRFIPAVWNADAGRVELGE